MATKQKLGIELSLTLDSKFSELVKQIENSFSKVDLKGFEAKIQGVEGKVGKLAEAIAKKLGTSAEVVQKSIDASSIASQMDVAIRKAADMGVAMKDANGKVVTSLQGMMSNGAQITAIIRNTNKAYSDLGTQINAANKNTAKYYSDLGTQINAANKNTEAAHKATVRGYVEKGNAIVAAERNTNKVYLDIGAQINAINKNTEAANRALVASYVEKGNAIVAIEKRTVQGMVERGTSILAIERNTNKAMLEERKRALQQLAAQKIDRNLEVAAGSALITGLSKQGLKLFNGEAVPKSYVTDIAKAHEAALKYNATLKANNEQLKQGQAYLDSLAARGKAHWNGQEISVQQYRKNLKELNGELSETSKRNRTFLDSFGGMARALTEFYLIRGALFAVRNQIQDAVKTVLDFNQSLYDTAAISGGTIASLQKMEQVAFSLATSSRFSATQIMEMTKILAQAGVASKDLPEATRVSTMFATGANATPAQAVDLMTTSMNVWNIEAKDSMRIANTLTAALNASKLEAGGLSTAFNYLANQGAQMNMSLEETAGIIATLSNVGVKPSTIGTGASGLIAAFAAPAPRFKALLAEFKVGLDEVNPMTHTFAEIIGRLEKAAIPTDAILASLDKRIARTLVSALNAGQQGFELMTRAVTGTDAALIANYKVMEGVRARFNVIKSEFAQAVKEFSDSIGGVLGGGLTALRALVLSLNTEGGKLVLTLGSITSAILLMVAAANALAVETTAVAKAFAFLKALNPEVKALGLVIAGVTAALAYFGTKKLNQKKQDEDFIKGIAQQADALQQAEMGVIGVMNSMDKSQKSKNGYIKLTNDQTTELVKLANKYPQYLGKLDLEHLKLEDLVKATNDLYEARKRNAAQIASDFNKQGADINTRSGYLKTDRDYSKLKSYAELNGLDADGSDPIKLVEAVKKYSDANPSDMRNILAEYISRNKADLGIVKAAIDKQSSLLPTLGGDYLVRNNYAIKAPEPAAKPKSTRWTTSESAGSIAKQENLDEKVQSDINDRKTQLAKLALDAMKLELDQLRENLNSDKDLDKYKKLAKEVAEKEYELAATEIRFRENNKLASTLKTKVNLDERGNIVGGITPDKTISKYLANQAIAYTKKVIEDEIDNAYMKAGLDYTKAGNTKLPASETKLSKDNTLRDEKIENARLAKVQAELQVRKDLAVTAEQVHALELEGLANQEQSLKNLEKIYQNRVSDVENDFMKYTDLVEYNQALETAKDNLDAVRLKLKGIRAEHAELANTDFFHNFNRGAASAVKSLGDFKTNTQQLGTDVANTGLTGMVNLLDQSIGKLAQLEWSWKSFSQTLGTVMKDIAAELQKYIAKMMVVWLVQKLVGLASSGGTGNTAMNSPSGDSVPAFQEIDFTNIREYADGGQVPLNIGHPGVDSVPAILTPGEIVISKPAVDKYGVDYFLKHNAQRFANGGFVGGASSKSSSKAEDGTPFTLNIINVTDPNDIPKTTGQDIINVISYDLSKNGVIKQQIKGILQGG